MGRLRVVLANMPHILRQILQDVLDRQPDMTVVGEARTLAQLPQVVATLRAQAVILTLSPPGVSQLVCRALRRQYPNLTVLGIVPRDDRAVLWLPKASPRPIELSAAAVVGALRGEADAGQP